MRFGYIEVGGAKIYGYPEDYTMFDRGSKSQMVATNTVPILDPGYGTLGFTLNGWVLQPGVVEYIDSLAEVALNDGVPLQVIDTLGPKSFWLGYFERPVLKVGKAYDPGLGLPSPILTTQVPLTFFSSEIELL
jgi:hypothetical protein